MNVPMELMSMEYKLQLRNHRMFFPQRQIAMCERGDKSNAWSNPFLPPRLFLPPHAVKLQNQNLWQEFHTETTEMIITKNGRRMFPSIQLNISGLAKTERYYILLEIRSVCNRRYKYCGNGAGQDEKNNGGWSYAGPAEPQPHFNHRIYTHPDGPATGDYWMQNTVNFNKLKLTNNAVDHRKNVLLTSMHKYMPIVWIIQCNNAETLIELFSHPAASFTFNETAFIAVTAYQNENITKLKIDNNPFAKGFRETGQSRCKRKYQDRDRKTDDDKNCSFESVESNPSVSSLDNFQERGFENSISDDDACDTVKRSTTITADRELPIREESNNNEMSTHFHRPWLDSPSSNRPAATTTSLSQTVSPYHCWLPSYFMPNFPQMFMQQPKFNYYHSLLHMSL